MVKIRACRLSQDTLLIVGRGSREITTLVAFFAYRQPGVALPVLSGCLASIWVAHARLACHGGSSAGVFKKSFVGMTDMETAYVVQ
jgi:hypothetical protein